MLHVLEMNPETLNMREDEEYIMGLEKDAAVVVVHNIGNVVNVPRLQRLRPDLIFVEDNCEAFLETYEDRKTGTASLCAAISFLQISSSQLGKVEHFTRTTRSCTTMCTNRAITGCHLSGTSMTFRDLITG